MIKLLLDRDFDQIVYNNYNIAEYLGRIVMLENKIIDRMGDWIFVETIVSENSTSRLFAFEEHFYENGQRTICDVYEVVYDEEINSYRRKTNTPYCIEKLLSGQQLSERNLEELESLYHFGKLDIIEEKDVEYEGVDREIVFHINDRYFRMYVYTRIEDFFDVITDIEEVVIKFVKK